MKHWILLSLAGLFLSVATVTPAEAATVVRTGETVSIQKDQRVDGNFYLLAGTASLSGPIDGDVVAAAGTVSINAPVLHDVLVLGGTVGVNATVTEDVRIVAGDVTLANTVEGSVFVLGGRLKVLSTATIKGDILFVGGEMTIEGTVTGALLGHAEKVRVDGVVEKGIDMQVVSLELGDRARVAGDVQYTSMTELERAPGATIDGDVIRNDLAKDDTVVTSYRTLAMAFLVSLFGSLLVYLVLRRLLELYFVPRVLEPLAPTLAGFVFVLLAPVLVLVLFVSVLGVTLGFVALASTLAVLALAILLTNLSAAVLLSSLVMKKATLNPMTITVGAVFVQLLFLVPVVGPIVLLLLFMLTVGSLVLILGQKIARR
jgi:cytoskeletal protein CcmA (bactofilin family)